MSDPATSQAMSTMVANLRSAIMTAQVDVQSSWSFADKSASLNALDMMQGNVETLDTAIRARVDNGEIPLSEFQSIAESDLSAIRAYDSNVTDYSGTNAWNYVAKQTAVQVREGAKEVVSETAGAIVSDYWPYLLAAAAVLFIILLLKLS